ncbi:hypothetical protein C2E23DRAFT_858605 [Lenzites betulinus]|nr:hypothetical protein C2E23DRAFT_858605 [Lenzites betulinus]
MYGLQLLDLPADTRFLRALLSPRDIDLGKLYLGVSLTIIISFMTYYRLIELVSPDHSFFSYPLSPRQTGIIVARWRTHPQHTQAGDQIPINSSGASSFRYLSIGATKLCKDILTCMFPKLEPSALANSGSVFQDRDNTSTPLHPDEPIPLMVNPAQTLEDDTELSVSAEFARPHHSVEIQPAMANGDPPAISQEEGASHSANSIPIGQENIGGVEEADGEMALNLVSNTASVLLQNPSDVSGHQRSPEQTETNERMTLRDFIDVSTSLMESAILVEEVASDSEQRNLDPDADREAGWTTVSCDDYGVQGEPSGLLDSVHKHALDEGGSKDVPPTYHSVEFSAVLVAPSDDLQQHTSKVTQSPRTCEVLLATPKPASTLNATSATLPHHLVLPKAPNQQLSTTSQTLESEDSVSIYIGPLSPKPMSARVHTEEKPDWAVAPNVRAKPRRSVKGSGPGNAAVDRQKGGRSRQAVTAKARSHAVPARSQGDVAQTTTQAGDRESTRRRSARLNPA